MLNLGLPLELSDGTPFPGPFTTAACHQDKGATHYATNAPNDGCWFNPDGRVWASGGVLQTLTVRNKIVIATIDITKPLETSQGTPVTYVEPAMEYTSKAAHYGTIGGGSFWWANDGKVYDGDGVLQSFTIRNVAPAPITYTTRDGRAARILATDLKNAAYPVVAVVTDTHGNETPQAFTADLRYYMNGESGDDLIPYVAPAPKPVLLPSVLSKLIRIALADLALVEANPAYKINMSDWHTARRGDSACAVCFAGAIMAQTLAAPASVTSGPGDFPANDRQLCAVDYLRSGQLAAAFSCLGLTRPATLPRTITIVRYDDNPDFFRTQMNDLANLLELNNV